MELAFLSAVEQARLIRVGEASSVELVQLCLERIERIDPALNAFVTVCGDEALASAERGAMRRSRSDGEGRNRTGDTTIFSRVLYQLSYLARGG